MLIYARAGARRQPEAARKGRERAAAQHGSEANGAGRAARRPWAAVGLRHKLNLGGQRAAKQAHQNKKPVTRDRLSPGRCGVSPLEGVTENAASGCRQGKAFPNFC